MDESIEEIHTTWQINSRWVDLGYRPVGHVICTFLIMCCAMYFKYRYMSTRRLFQISMNNFSILGRETKKALILKVWLIRELTGSK